MARECEGIPPYQKGVFLLGLTEMAPPEKMSWQFCLTRVESHASPVQKEVYPALVHIQDYLKEKETTHPPIAATAFEKSTPRQAISLPLLVSLPWIRPASPSRKALFFFFLNAKNTFRVFGF